MGRKGKRPPVEPEAPDVFVHGVLAEEQAEDVAAFKQGIADAEKEADEHGGIAKVLSAAALDIILNDDVDGPATAPTEECARHVADTDAEHCIRCSKPLQLMSVAQQKLAIMRRDAHVLALEIPDEACAELIERPLQSDLVQISRLWADRAVTMAGKQRMTLPAFIELLIKRQWIASGGGRG